MKTARFRAPRLKAPDLKAPREAGTRRRKGFSLIEVMVALAVLAYGVLGVTAGHLLAMRVSTNSRIATEAMDLAEEQMEIFQSMNASDVIALRSAPGYPIDPEYASDPDFERRWLITEDSPEAGVIALTVEVDWTNALGNTITTRIASLKADS